MKDANLTQEEIEALFNSLTQASEETREKAGEKEARKKGEEDQKVSQKAKQEISHKDAVSLEDFKQEPPRTSRAPSVRKAVFEELSKEPAPNVPLSGMEVLMDIPLSVSVELGRTRCYVKDLLNLTSGSIVELDRLAGDPVDILVNGKLFAKGEVVVIDENFGVRIREILAKGDEEPSKK